MYMQPILCAQCCVTARDHFYKDRHYLHLVFPELRPPGPADSEPAHGAGADLVEESGARGMAITTTTTTTSSGGSSRSGSGSGGRAGDSSGAAPVSLRLLEVGCGVGNAVFPLLQMHPGLFVHAIDHAKSAVAILK